MNGGPCDIRVLGTAELHTVRKRRERFHVFRLVPADEPFGPSPSSPERSQPECSAEGAGINLEDSWQVGAAAKEAWQVQGTQCASTVQSN